jgi:hypothetical protein
MDQDSPLNNIPVEILQEIFFQCLPNPSSIHALPGFWCQELFASPKNAPLLLCNVCKQWRTVAISSPNLWATMSVIVRLGVAVPAPDLLSLWLYRSGALPLNLALYQQNECPANRAVTGHILRLFKRHISRWGDIHLEIHGYSDHQSLALDEQAGLQLHKFRLHASQLYPEQEKDLFTVLHHAPRLESLHVSRIPDLDLFGVSPIPIPWPQLVHLCLDYVPAVGTALHILNMCPGLETCHMKVDAARGSFLCHPSGLSKLRTLSINLASESLACFLEQLTLPQLVDLTIFVRGPLEQYGWAQEQFDAFLIRSSCRVRRLEIHDTGMNSLEFTACIQHVGLQALAELIVDDTRGWTWDPFVTQEALRLLTFPALRGQACAYGATSSREFYTSGVPHQFYLLPFLDKLTIRGNCLLSPDGIVADMVESRWTCHNGKVARLKLVEVELPADHVEDMRRLKELQGEGLEVILPQHY